MIELVEWLILILYLKLLPTKEVCWEFIGSFCLLFGFNDMVY